METVQSSVMKVVCLFARRIASGGKKWRKKGTKTQQFLEKDASIITMMMYEIMNMLYYLFNGQKHVKWE